MKKLPVFSGTIALVFACLTLNPSNLNAQEEESSSPFSTGGDLVSNYIWRGSKSGTGPAIQPYVDLTLGGFSIGSWGSYCFTTSEGAEADLYAAYSFDFGLSLGVTDYYFPGSDYFDYSSSDTAGSHGFEINLGYEIAGFSIGANYMLNEAANAGTEGGDLYFELGYGFKNFSIFAGAGNGWHTVESATDEADFNLCNIGISTSTEIEITEKFALPVSGSLIWNPDTEQFYIVVGVSF